MRVRGGEFGLYFLLQHLKHHILWRWFAIKANWFSWNELGLFLPSDVTVNPLQAFGRHLWDGSMLYVRCWL